MEWSKFLLIWIAVLLFLITNCSTTDPLHEVVVPVASDLQGTFPEDGETIETTSVTFIWNHAEHEPEDHYYSLLLDTLNPPQMVYSETTSLHHLESVDITSGVEYYWQIVCSDSCISEIYSFSVEKQDHPALVADLKNSLYLIGVLYDYELYGVGTGFAINEQEIMTNAHVVNALRDIIRSYGSEDLSLVALKDGYSTESEYCFTLEASRVHPHYDYVDVFTCDFGILSVANGELSTHLEFASPEEMDMLAVGDEIFTLGFPGETNDLDLTVAISTYKNGTISALRPLEGSGEQFGNSVIQHNCNTTAGTSGSPIFNMDGKVIAVHNSGEYEFVYSYDDYGSNLVRIPVGALNYAIRADLRSELDEAEMVSFDNIDKDTVWYTFINGTWSNIEITFVDLFSEYIGYQDTLEFWDYPGFAGISKIEATTLFDNHNYMWKDTLPVGKDFEKHYFVDSTLFLLGISNKTNQVLDELYVSNNEIVDMADTYISTYQYKDVGYFPSAESTAIELRFYGSKIPVYYEKLNTIGDKGEALFLFLEPDNELPDTRTISVKSDPGEKRVYRLSDYIRSLESQ